MRKLSELEEIIYDVADGIEQVDLEGCRYECRDLAKFIIYFEPARIKQDPIRLQADDMYNQEYNSFKKDYLEPNIDQIKHLFKLAQERMNRMRDQKEIFGEE